MVQIALLRNTSCFLKEMGNAVSALIWKVFCAEFSHWCPSDTQSKKLDNVLPDLRYVTKSSRGNSLESKG